MHWSFHDNPQALELVASLGSSIVTDLCCMQPHIISKICDNPELVIAIYESSIAISETSYTKRLRISSWAHLMFRKNDPPQIQFGRSH